MIRDLPFSTVAELSSHVRHMRVSSVKLTEYYLERLEKLGPSYNAVAAVLRDRALAEASGADKELRGGRYRGPLHGIPYAVKDLFAVKGAPTTWGAAPYRNQTFDIDAAVVRKLRDAGAVLIGKLSMVELAGGLGYKFANASLQGAGKNPWDPGRWTGGSSSGSGAAVAAALVPFAIGTETWGSILCPSAFCGITGVRPTYGRVSRAGAMALSWTFDKIGPIARTAEDCRMVLTAIAGPDPDDASALDHRPDFSAKRGKPLGKLRIARLREEWKGEPEVKAAVDKAVEELKKTGAKIEDAKLPDFEYETVASLLIRVEAVSAFESLYRDGRVRMLTDKNAPLQREVLKSVSGADYVRLLRLRERMLVIAHEFFKKYDAIVSHNFQNVAPPIDADLDQALAGADTLGGFANACGLPGVAIPCGTGKNGMPVGIQLVGPPLSEPTLLNLAQAYQSRTKWHRRYPSGASESAKGL